MGVLVNLGHVSDATLVLSVLLNLANAPASTIATTVHILVFFAPQTLGGTMKSGVFRAIAATGLAQSEYASSMVARYGDFFLTVRAVMCVDRSGAAGSSRDNAKAAEESRHE